SKEKLQELIAYKFKTKPAQQIVPFAIESKFRHTDRTFFTTFTRAKRFMPQHQTEYENRFTSALQKYKAEHKITITDKQTRDKIHLKLCQKLYIDHIANTNFNTCSQKHTYQLLTYYKGFTRDEKAIDKEDIQEAIAEATRSKLQKLPDTSINISDEIKAILLFELLIKFKSQMKAVVTALHKVFKFKKLPSTYF